jgi:twitching motility protein PilT
MAMSVMMNTPAVANLIRDGKTAQLYSQIQTGGRYGMQTLERALANLVETGEITLEEAKAHSSRVEELNRLLER